MNVKSRTSCKIFDHKSLVLSLDDMTLETSEFSEPPTGTVILITCVDKVMLTNRASIQDDVIKYQSRSALID